MLTGARHRRSIWLSIVALVATACGPSLTESERRVVYAYLQCDECVDGELEAVVTVGFSAVPFLEEILASGPDGGLQHVKRAELVRIWNRIEGVSASDPDLASGANFFEFAQRHLEHFDARYRIRAAYALATIGGSAAERAICDAIAAPPPPLATSGIVRAAASAFIVC